VRGVDVAEVSTPLRTDASLDAKRALGFPDSKRAMLTAWTPSVPGLWVPRVHAVTANNEIAALLRRSLGPTPDSAETSRRPVLDAFKELRRVAGRYGGSRWSYRETAHSYTGALRRRYLEAERSLMEDGPLSSSDYVLKAFLKAEKVRGGLLTKPRMIFPRSPRYNLHLASWLKPFEHWLWGNLKSVGSSGVAPSRVVAKGLSPGRRANLIVRKFSAVPDCVVFEVDGKAFEAHCDVWQLLQEHTVYESAYPGDSGLKKTLNKQLRNFGFTRCGVRFARGGGRASGDFNTGMGNTMVMLCVVAGVMSTLGVPLWDSLVDGDNALLFLPRSVVSRVVENFHATALEISGHEMVLERAVDFLEGVRFGQSAPVKTARGWTMVRDWKKVLSLGTSSHAHLREPLFAREFLQGVSLCELSLARDVPILGAWAESLRRATHDGSAVRLHPHRDYEYLGVDFDQVESATYEPPSAVARRSFCLAFGVEPEEQVCIEEMCLSLRGLDLSRVSWYDPLDFVPGDDLCS